MRKTFFIITIPFLLFAQEETINSLTINASSIVHVVADIVYFSITLSTINDDAQIAFDEHKKLEKNLISLFHEFSIPDSSIQYSLLNIHRSQPRSNEINFVTNQNVKIIFKDLSQYNRFQIRLLQSGFYQFRSGFGSSQVKRARVEGYKNALENARRDAEIIAETLGKKVGEILEISTRTNEFEQLDHSSALRVSTVNSLIEIEQTVAAQTNLTVKFSLL